MTFSVSDDEPVILIFFLFLTNVCKQNIFFSYTNYTVRVCSLFSQQCSNFLKCSLAQKTWIYGNEMFRILTLLLVVLTPLTEVCNNVVVASRVRMAVSSDNFRYVG